MKNPIRSVGKKTGEKAKEAIDDFTEAFQNSDYEIEFIVAELQLSPNPIKNIGTLQIKIKKK
jgi:hypothetical protein